MQNLLARFTKIQKIIIGIALLIIAGALTFFVATQKENKPQVVNTNLNTNTLTNTENQNKDYQLALGIYSIDFTNWKVALGKDKTAVDPFWQDVVGRAEYDKEKDKDIAYRTLVVKESNLSLDEFYSRKDILKPSSKSEKIIFSGFPAIKNRLENAYDKEKNIWHTDQMILINRDGVFYYLTDSLTASSLFALKNYGDMFRYDFNFGLLGDSSVTIFSDSLMGLRFEYPTSMSVDSYHPSQSDSREYMMLNEDAGYLRSMGGLFSLNIDTEKDNKPLDESVPLLSLRVLGNEQIKETTVGGYRALYKDEPVSCHKDYAGRLGCVNRKSMIVKVNDILYWFSFEKQSDNKEEIQKIIPAREALISSVKFF